MVTTRKVFIVKNCSEDKFFSMKDCFYDVCENPEKFETSTVFTSHEKFSKNSVTFRVDCTDAFSLHFAEYMVKTFNYFQRTI